MERGGLHPPTPPENPLNNFAFAKLLRGFSLFWCVFRVSFCLKSVLYWRHSQDIFYTGLILFVS